jgi:hypothetical protein
MNESEIINATVKLIAAQTARPKQTGRGQGVLIPGSMIITAAHCLDLSRVGPLMLENEYSADIVTRRRTKIRGIPVFVDPISDVAVIGIPAGKDQFKFDAFCKETPAVPISAIKVKLRSKFPVRIRAHTGRWIEGIGMFVGDKRNRINITACKPIPGGTSGGPVVDENGTLLGVVSVATENDKFCSIAFARRSLPTWVLDWSDDRRRQRLIEDMKRTAASNQFKRTKVKPLRQRRNT